MTQMTQIEDKEKKSVQSEKSVVTWPGLYNSPTWRIIHRHQHSILPVNEHELKETQKKKFVPIRVIRGKKRKHFPPRITRIHTN